MALKARAAAQEDGFAFSQDLPRRLERWLQSLGGFPIAGGYARERDVELAARLAVPGRRDFRIRKASSQQECK